MIRWRERRLSTDEKILYGCRAVVVDQPLRWRAVALVVAIAVLSALVMLVAGCTSMVYERTDTGTRLSHTSLWKDFEGVDATYGVGDTKATLTVGQSTTHQLTPDERAAVRAAVLGILKDAAAPVVP